MLDLAKFFETRVRNDEIKFVVLLEATHRDQNVGSGQRGGDFGQRHFERLQFVWIDSDPVFLDPSALNADTRDSLNCRKRGAQSVKRQIAQLYQRMRIRSQTV